jgi:uncharacterized protein DUF732
MNVTRLAMVAAAAIAAPLVLATPAHADPDIDFANQLHGFGIYGPRDYNAWIGKIMCKRMYNNVDTTASQSATFIRNQLDRDSSTEQVWQFVGLAVDYYCPDKRVVLDHAA